MGVYAPRGALSRALFEKLHNDAHLNALDYTAWYILQNDLPSQYQSKFINFEPDDRTLSWLDTAKAKSANLWMQILHICARFLLSIFMTQTDVNGVLKRGSMFILSEDQLVTLVTRGGFNMPTHGFAKVLDIGAGDGMCTERVQKSLHRMVNETLGTSSPLPPIFVTETSWIMRKRLEKYDNFTVIEVDEVNKLSGVDLVTCLNVLDRCADPIQMLRDIHSILSPTGRAIFALVLPYSHYVETNTSHLPVRPLLSSYSGATAAGCGSCGDSCDYNKRRRPVFEEEARMFFEQLEENGFKVEAWTKAPYLCEGDIRQSFYYLIDIVVIVSKAKANVHNRSCKKGCHHQKD